MLRGSLMLKRQMMLPTMTMVTQLLETAMCKMPEGRWKFWVLTFEDGDILGPALSATLKREGGGGGGRGKEEEGE